MKYYVHGLNFSDLYRRTKMALSESQRKKIINENNARNNAANSRYAGKQFSVFSSGGDLIRTVRASQLIDMSPEAENIEIAIDQLTKSGYTVIEVQDEN